MSGDYRDASVEVRRDIGKHFADALADCDRIREYAVGMFENWAGRRIESTADALVKAIFARSTDTFTCVMRCVRLGYGAQAAMLNRSLFEDMVDAHWIATAPDTAAEQYADHHKHGQMLLADAAATFPAIFAKEDLPESDPEERKRLDGLFGKRGTKSWSQLNIYERVDAIRHQWTSEDGREALRFMLVVAHRENNQALHVSAQSLHAASVTDDSGRTTFLVGPRTGMVNRSMFGAFWTFAQTISLVLDRFDFPTTSSEREAMFSTAHFSLPDDPDALRF